MVTAVNSSKSIHNLSIYKGAFKGCEEDDKSKLFETRGEPNGSSDSSKLIQKNEVIAANSTKSICRTYKFTKVL